MSLGPDRYQQIPLSLITSQLAFEDLVEARDFLNQLEAAKFKPATATTAKSATGERDDMLDCKLAHAALAQAYGKYNKVDLKGQI